MKIAHIASEVYPFSKTGGLADVVSALPLSLKANGLECFVISPLYKNIINNFPLKKSKESIDIQVGTDIYNIQIFQYKKSGVHYIFLSNPYLFERDGLYTSNGKDYSDNCLRFGIFTKAALHFITNSIGTLDIIHCHDWQTALTAPLLKTEFQDIKAKVVFTIHNIAFQGIFDFSELSKLNLDTWLFGFGGFEYYGKANLMKCAIIKSDAVTTVSPTYANEIQTPELGYGLEGVLSEHSYKLQGILNGIDYNVWSPQKDKHIIQKYSQKSTKRGKTINKDYLLNRFNLPKDKPLFGFVSRFTKQKGIDITIDIIKKFHKDINFILLGDGDSSVKQELETLNSLKEAAIQFGYNEPLSRQIYAGSDFYLMPSLFEPCGLSQLIAMKYGAIPIVRKTGGLSDTIVDISSNGYGIIFEDYTTDSFANAIDRALSVYHKGESDQFYRLAMEKDFSWNESSKQYITLYKKLRG